METRFDYLMKLAEIEAEDQQNVGLLLEALRASIVDDTETVILKLEEHIAMQKALYVFDWVNHPEYIIVEKRGDEWWATYRGEEQMVWNPKL